MREILDELDRRYRDGEAVAVGTVVSTFRSAPRGPGASMLVAQDGTVTGSVSGGCVEGDVYELGRSVIDSGQPVLQRYGVSDDDAFSVGLTCGGIIDVFVERIDAASFPAFTDLLDSVRAGEPVALATVTAHPDPALRGRRMVVWRDRADGQLASSRMYDAVVDDARGLLEVGRSGTLHYGTDGERRGEGMSVFVNVFQPPPRLIVFGAIDFASAMARLGSFLGYTVTVCDARGVFATEARFPGAHEVIVDWPHRYLAAEAEAGRVDARTVITVLTHDPKFDVPLLEVALRLDVAYVGAMGSRRTHDDRMERLRETGLTEEELARLSSPIGLDLGARTPEETAVSIAAEIIALRWGGGGGRLAETRGPIHAHEEHIGAQKY
ncbi:XdhC family protein [Rhodococcus pyridinivorans]|uniref:Xanthine and CO dehydrogenases maturation factor, XdhC/CoxF family protein n=1 Tax=Rhodococcus pyridinivorans AK37 TaxID=1114960 RepID=H0JMM9_9NOCA|nr:MULTISPECIES: XdhC/CoxI family protein [Rhodococcus]AOD21182.1 XshC-Cox1 family protein [Rhodococcus sp. p52]AWZ23150.1 XshC-Cox1 family protein [Rhodococcus pyridinivorans]EHK85439.1 xanthine and CO dehydrogenases maturation factor, XdhC/CoxF family protein [Rhodococcus pyridinivorans AK37]MCD2118742.1 XdhC family protein [Rhodococcus pyridinivorans]MCD2140791.1 XdhC family protein [Rhodococcus pyridinivorans]